MGSNFNKTLDRYNTHFQEFEGNLLDFEPPLLLIIVFFVTSHYGLLVRFVALVFDEFYP